MASKKDFSKVGTRIVLDAITDATAETAQPAKKERKKTEAYSPEAAAAMMAAGTTQGRKGCGAARINMAFSPAVYDYIKTMARVSGLSITEFTELVFAKSMEENGELYKKALAFRNSL